MSVFTVLILWVFITYVISNKIRCKDNMTKKKIYCFLVFIALTFVAGFRSRYVGGVDTNVVYIPTFERICGMTMEQISLRYSKDISFYMLTKLFTYISTDYRVYLLVIALFITGSYCRFVYLYSNYPLMSFLTFFALGYYGAEFQLLRHCIALSILLYAYPYIRDKMLLKFLIVVFIASLFHSTAVVFLLAYPISHVKIGLKQWGAIIAVIVLCYYGKSIVKYIMNFMLADVERYSNYIAANYSVTLSVTGALILICLYFVSFVLTNKVSRGEEEVKILFNMSALSICFMAMVLIIGEFHRISMYFGIYNTLLLPASIDSYRRNGKRSREKIIIIMAIMLILIVYFLLFRLENDALNNYKFYWQ